MKGLLQERFVPFNHRRTITTTKLATKNTTPHTPPKPLNTHHPNVNKFEHSPHHEIELTTTKSLPKHTLETLVKEVSMAENECMEGEVEVVEPDEGEPLETEEETNEEKPLETKETTLEENNKEGLVAESDVVEEVVEVLEEAELEKEEGISLGGPQTKSFLCKEESTLAPQELVVFNLEESRVPCVIELMSCMDGTFESKTKPFQAEEYDAGASSKTLGKGHNLSSAEEYDAGASLTSYTSMKHKWKEKESRHLRLI